MFEAPARALQAAHPSWRSPCVVLAHLHGSRDASSKRIQAKRRPAVASPTRQLQPSPPATAPPPLIGEPCSSSSSGGREDAGQQPLHLLILTARSCSEVAALALRARSCSTADLTAAINRCVRLHQAAGRRQDVGPGARQLAVDRAALRGLLQLASLRLGQLDAWAVTQCLWAAATMQVAAEPQGAWRARLAQLLPGAGRQTVALSLWAACRLRWQLGAGGGQLAAAADVAVRRTAGGMSCRDCAQVAWAFAAGGQGWRLDEAAAAALLRRLERTLPLANAQDAANVAWAAMQLGWPLPPGSPLAAALDAAVQRTAAEMTPQAVSNTLLAYGAMGLQLSAAACAALQQRLLHVLPQAATPQAVANALKGASQMGWRLGGPLAEAAEAALLRTLPGATPEGVADCLWAYGHAGWPLSAAARAAFLRALQRTLPSASAAQLADCFRGLGLLRLNPGPEILAAGAAAMEGLLRASWGGECGSGGGSSGSATAAAAAAAGSGPPALPVQALRNLLWCVARLGAAPPAGPLLQLSAEWTAAQLAAGRLSALEACDLLYSLTRLGLTLPHELLQAAVHRSLEQLDAGEADGTHFAGLIWSCSQGGLMLRPPALAALVGPSLAAVLPAWQAGDRGAAGGGILLVEGLSRQEGFASAAADSPCLRASLASLVPLVAEDIRLAAAGATLPLAAGGSEMGWLAAWAGSLAVLGLPLPSLPADQLASLAARRKAELRPVDRDQLGRAFAACGHQGGMALLDALDAAGQH